MPILATVLLLAGCGGGGGADELVFTPKQHGNWLLVLLHGATGRPDGLLQPELLAALQALGPRAPVLLLPDGGYDSYWHDRRDSRTATATLAAIARLHYPRVAIGGISMGGYGALLLGHRRHFCAVGARSPALWRRFADTAPGAFDDAADFARNDIVGHPSSYGRTPVWIDVGTKDGFRPTAVLYAHEVGAQLHVWPGGHDSAYWRAHMRDYLEFYAAACA